MKDNLSVGKKLLLGTTNQTKLDRLRAIVQSLLIECVSLRDLEIHAEVRETGSTPEENALLKARAYFARTSVPTLAVDSALVIDSLPPEKQPGLCVRRLGGKQASDSELLDYYVRELEEVGGHSRGRWTTAVALAVSEDQTFCSSFVVETLLTSKASPVVNPGEPLNSIQILPTTKKYKSEMTPEERLGIESEADPRILTFIKEHLRYL